MPNLRQYWFITLIVGAMGGSLASWAGWPLPWVIGALVAWALGAGLGVPWLSLALGMMPGSAPEMSLTAEALGLAVALVTAMQVIRMLLIQAACLPLYRLLNPEPQVQAPSSAKSA